MGRDPDYLGFMRVVTSALAANAELSLEQERAAIEDSMRHVPRMPVGKVRDLEVDGGAGPLPARLYRPDAMAASPALVYFHGGGWSIGSVESWDPVVRDLVAASGVAMLAVDQRQAPEHPFPAAVEDAHAATVWAASHAEELGIDADRLGVGGDSSGANLAAVTALRLRDAGGPALAAQLLVYGTFDLTEIPPRPPDPDDLARPEDDRAQILARYLGGADPAQPDVSPMLAPDHARLAPAIVVTAEYDRVRPQGLAYAQRLRDAGVPVTLLDCAGLDHAFLAWGSFARRPRAAITEIGAALAETI